MKLESGEAGEEHIDRQVTSVNHRLKLPPKVSALNLICDRRHAVARVGRQMESISRITSMLDTGLMSPISRTKCGC